MASPEDLNAFEEVLFFGDSLTWGMSHKYTGRYQESYPQMLEQRLNKLGYGMVENALCSRTTSLDDSKFDEWLVGGEPHYFNGSSHFMSEFLSHRVSALVLLLGTNDLKTRMREQAKISLSKSSTFSLATHIADSCGKIGRMAQKVPGKESLLVIVICPPPVRLCSHSMDLGFDQESVHLSLQFPRAFRDMCEKYGFHYVGVPWIDMEKSVDGVHITLEDTRKLAEAVWSEALLPLLRDTGKSIAIVDELETDEDITVVKPRFESLSWFQCGECQKWRLNQWVRRSRWTCRQNFWLLSQQEWKSGCGWNEDERIECQSSHPDAINVIDIPFHAQPLTMTTTTTIPPSASIEAVTATTTPPVVPTPMVVSEEVVQQPITSKPPRPRGRPPGSNTSSSVKSLKLQPTPPLLHPHFHQQQQPVNLPKPQRNASFHNTSAAAAAATSPLSTSVLMTSLLPPLPMHSLPSSYHQPYYSNYSMMPQAPPPPWSSHDSAPFKMFVERLLTMCIDAPLFRNQLAQSAEVIMNSEEPLISQSKAMSDLKQLFASYPQVAHDLNCLVATHPKIGSQANRPTPFQPSFVGFPPPNAFHGGFNFLQTSYFPTSASSQPF